MIKKILLFFIRFLESFEKDNTGKIQGTFNIDLNVKCDKGFEKALQIHKIRKEIVYELKVNMRTLYCADNHIVFNDKGIPVKVKDLNENDWIMIDIGIRKVQSIKKLNYKIEMFDLSIDSENHRYYTNNILSHNTTTTSIFLTHYFCFNFDKTILFLSNKYGTTTEIIRKVKEIIGRVPFFLKPGVYNVNKGGVSADNGNTLIGQPTTENAGIGFTINALYIDEFAHIDNNIVNNLYENAYPTLTADPNSKFLISSTQNGFNKFYDLWNGAVKKENAFTPIEVQWHQVNGRTEEWKKEQIIALGSEDAFEKQFGTNFITGDLLLLNTNQIYFIEKNLKEYKFFSFDNLDSVKDNINYIRSKNDLLCDWSYEDLIFTSDCEIDFKNINKHFFVSVDLSEGIGGDDTVFDFYEIEYDDNNLDFTLKKNLFRLKQFGLFKNNRTTLDETAMLLYVIVTKIFANSENVKLIIEWNKYGEALLEKILKIDGDKNNFDVECIVKYFHKSNDVYKKNGLLQGENKTKNCLEFKNLVANKKIIINNKHTLEQFKMFGKKNKIRLSYSSLKGKDDCAMTSINLSTIFSNNIFDDICDDLYDNLEYEKKVNYMNFNNIVNADESVYDVLFEVEKKIRI